jgi:hypothetical protein
VNPLYLDYYASRYYPWEDYLYDDSGYYLVKKPRGEYILDI